MKNRSDYPLIEFNPRLPKLSANEKAVLKLLVEAGRLIAPIYLEQENQLKNGPSKEELEKAAKKNPDILSPYTVVERVGSELQATFYHIKFAHLLKPIVDKLNKAVNLCEDRDFTKYLKLKAKTLLEGTYSEILPIWLKTKSYILDVSIGPIVHRDDRLFYAKASYQAWVGLIDREGSKQFNYYKDMILSVQRRALIPEARVENYHQVGAIVEDVILFSGHMARTKFVGVNIPMHIEWVEKYGSRVTLFKQANNLRVQEQIIPTFNKIFSPSFRQGFSVDDLKLGNISYVGLHELAHSYLYYKNAPKVLQELLSPIYELAANILGLKMAGSLLLRDIITNKQLESMVVTFTCRCFYLVAKSKQSQFWVNYGTGGAIFINFMLKSGALKQYKGQIIPNFMRIFISLQDLLFCLEDILSSGSRKDAEKFIKKYGQFKNLP